MYFCKQGKKDNFIPFLKSFSTYPYNIKGNKNMSEKHLDTGL